MRHFDIRKMKRREFLKLLGGISAAPLMSQLSELAYGAGPFNDYRALVCVFLFGGNDAHNMIVPLDGRYATYAANRGPPALHWPICRPTRSPTRCREASVCIRA